MRWLLIISCCFVAITSQAQWSYKFMSRQKHSLYTSGDYIVGKSNGGDLGLNYVYNNKYLINFGYTASNKSDYQVPTGFTKSATNITPAYAQAPFQNEENLHIMVGRIFNLNKNGTIRLIVQGGPGISTIRKPGFFESNNELNYKMIASQYPCVTLNPKLQLPLFYALGFSMGPMVVISSEQKYIGAGIGIMYGILRN